MFKTMLSVAALVASTGFAVAQACGTTNLLDDLSESERARLGELVAPHAFARGNVWEAVKDGSRAIVVGTLHIPDASFDEMVSRLTPEVEKADLLILEATQEDEAEIARLAATRPEMFFLTEGPSLIDLLGPEDWSLAADRLSEIGVPGFIGAKFQPWYMSMTLAVPPCALDLIQSGQKGLDRRLEAVAKSNSIPLAALDDTEDVLALFADEPIEVQLKGLRLSLNTQMDNAAATSTLIESYFEGRVREGWEFTRILIDRLGIEDGQAMFDDINTGLLLERNKKWDAQFSDLIDGKSVVIAVGAAHLSGETGVLRALERAGYTLRPY